MTADERYILGRAPIELTMTRVNLPLIAAAKSLTARGLLRLEQTEGRACGDALRIRAWLTLAGAEAYAREMSA